MGQEPFGNTRTSGDWQDCVPLNQIELVMVPGVAFDRLGGRIGMGKGFYDRALEEFSGVKWHRLLFVKSVRIWCQWSLMI